MLTGVHARRLQPSLLNSRALLERSHGLINHDAELAQARHDVEHGYTSKDLARAADWRLAGQCWRGRRVDEAAMEGEWSGDERDRNAEVRLGGSGGLLWVL